MKHEAHNMEHKARNIKHGSGNAPCFMLHASCNGFTIIESLVAVAILLLALTGPMTLAERSLASAEVARQELTVLYLAQEGIEFIRNTRDSNFLVDKREKEDWLNGLSKCTLVNGCGVDLTATDEENQIIVCDDIENKNCLLTKNIKDVSFAKGLFSHKFAGNPPSHGWESSNIYRKICIVGVGVIDSCAAEDAKKSLKNESEVKVNVIMEWNVGALGERKLIISSNLSNWYLK